MKTGSKSLAAALLAATFLLGSNAMAQAASAGAPAGPAKTAAAESAALTDAEVRKVDKENRKITLRHGEIRDLDMPAMTMVFQVRDPALLDAVKAGDKVRFQAERAQGSFWVTALEPAR